MSKSKFKVQRGLACIQTTGEPVYVQDIYTDTDLLGRTQQLANVVRAVVTTDGIVHRTEVFPVEQLETRFEQAKRGVELENFINELRREAESRMYDLNKAQLKSLQDIAAQAKNHSKVIMEGING